MTATATGQAPAVAAPPDTLGRRARVEQVMGMPISIHVRAEDPDRPEVDAAMSRAFAHLHLVDSIFSTWRSDSDLLRLQHGEIELDEAHPWLAEVVELCLEAEEVTDGLFSAWRPGAGNTRRIFDPTGLVKGWGVVGAGAHLQLVDEISWCIGAGGDLAMGTGRGTQQGWPLWRVGIEDPSDRSRVADVVALSTGGMATSGAAARGGHVVDPATGAQVTRPGSVTVTGRDLVRADVWATAAWVDPQRAATLMASRDPAYTLLAL